MRRRPAETTGAAGGLVAVVAALVGLPVEVVAALAAVAGALPAVVTWVVERGGVRGVARLVWRGRA
jgi:energy-converting hydrogenase Eha subunit A